jgi:hypothetical protein
MPVLPEIISVEVKHDARWRLSLARTPFPDPSREALQGQGLLARHAASRLFGSAFTNASNCALDLNFDRPR